jgi:hypothetical protein
MDIETVPLAELQRPPRNVRLHPEAQIVELMRAVEMFGQTRPVVIDEENVVWAGNGLFTALERLGRENAQALRISGLTKAAKAKLMLSDNKIYSLGHDDYDGMMSMIRGLDDLDIPGFDGDLLSNLISNDAVASEALNGFGRMSDAEREERSRPVTPVRTASGTRMVTCPHCGKEFAIT